MSPSIPSPTAAESVSWKVKHDGECCRCGAPLLRGAPAVWERASRSIRCIECPEASAGAEQPRLDSGVAGGSSRREYERLAAKREASIEARFGHGIVGKVVRAVTVEPQSTRAWAIGAVGEEKLAAELSSVPAIRVLNDRRVPGTRGNIDHVVIAPAGVFVVDAKHYEGRIAIRDRGWLLRPDYRLTIGGRDKSKLARDMGWQVDAVAGVLRAAGVEPLPPITAILCFIDGDWPLFGAPEEFEGVRLEGPHSIKRLLTRSVLLGEETIDHLANVIGLALPPR